MDTRLLIGPAGTISKSAKTFRIRWRLAAIAFSRLYTIFFVEEKNRLNEGTLFGGNYGLSGI
jgi:hypothetical protein